MFLASYATSLVQLVGGDINKAVQAVERGLLEDLDQQ